MAGGDVGEEIAYRQLRSVSTWYNPRMKSEKTLDGKVSLILEAVISLQGQVSVLQRDMATKDFVEVTVEKVRDDLLTEIRAIGHAVDKDALTIINHEHRITHLERQVV